MRDFTEATREQIIMEVMNLDEKVAALTASLASVTKERDDYYQNWQEMKHYKKVRVEDLEQQLAAQAQEIKELRGLALNDFLLTDGKPTSYRSMFEIEKNSIMEMQDDLAAKDRILAALAEKEKLIDAWIAEAKMGVTNRDYWKTRAEAAERKAAKTEEKP